MDDRAWLSGLFRSNYELLYRVGSLFLGAGKGALVEDQIQEVFLLAWKKRRTLREHPNPAGWLVEALRRRLMALGRGMARESRLHAFSLDDRGRDEEGRAHEPEDTRCVRPEDFLIGEERRALLTELLGREDADLFWRYCIVGSRASELAGRYRISEEAVRMRVSRIKRRLLASRELFYAVALALLGL